MNGGRDGDSKRGAGFEPRAERPVGAGERGATSGAAHRGAGAAPPAPTLPKGGGAIRGIGEKFSANTATGTASLEIPLASSPGRGGATLDLSLRYDSGNGNGPFGHGVHLSVPQITRKTDKGLPTYDDDDVFILSGAEDLAPKRLAGAAWARERFDDGGEIVDRYAPRVEGLFARIERREQKATGVVYWRVTTRDAVTSVYGKTAAARIADPRDPGRVFSWLLEETRDDRGNVTTYGYKAEDLHGVPRTAPWEAQRHAGDAPVVNRYLKRIRYGNAVPFDPTPELASALFEVVFDYGEHAAEAPGVDEVGGWPCRSDPFSTYRAGFEIRTYRLCRRVLTFHRMAELGATPCLVRSTDLAYAESATLTQLVGVRHVGYLRDAKGLSYEKLALPELELSFALPAIRTEIRTLDPASVADLPGAVDGSYQWVDLDGEGIPGVLAEQGGALYYKRNLGGGALAPAGALLRQPSLAKLGDASHQFTDLDGDGLKELAVFSPPEVGYFDRTAGGGFAAFQSFAAQPRIDWTDENLRQIDLSGDGLDDLLIARDGIFTWYPSLAKGGFGAPITFRAPRDDEKGAALVFADGTRTIFLADMSGDGLTDLVRIENGNVCYWPNLGYGRFGAKVRMGGDTWFDNPEAFDPRRIRLADVDGSGTTDVVYLHRSGVRISENQAGNALAPPLILPLFPDASDLSSITLIDLLGTGTSCLVWSTALPAERLRSIRYVDLLGGRKPHLLTSYRNNLGLEVRLEYTASTKFFLEDAVRGSPWKTRLPFPVQVVTRVESYDAISRHRFVSVYAYHHGYFDGVEREFRGFGATEQWDTESFSRFSGMGDLPPPANATDPELHLPAVRTKTWFHTGVWPEPFGAPSYAAEYYAGDALAVPLPEVRLPSGTADELREAWRSLKGQLIRQEIYAEDGSPQAAHPYLVAERTYEVRCLQPIVGSAHGVFIAHPREAVEHHYERNPNDPRVSHTLTLEVDDFGAVLRTAAVGYPRRAALAEFDEQRKLAIALTELDVVNHAPSMSSDWYRLGVPIETCTYELTGVSPRPDGLLSFDALLAAADAATSIPFDATPRGTVEKRLLACSRSIYARDDLIGPLPFGQIESLALPWQSYAKAFSAELASDILHGRVTDAILLEGGYARLEGDDGWWIPSGRQVFDKDSFYLPVAFIDAFGNTATVAYDAYALRVTQASDPVKNVVTASYDLRALAPREVTDADGNRSQARFDALGMVVATAVMGKVGGPVEGDTLDDPTATFAYDLDRYRSSGKPSVVHVRVREHHAVPDTRWQESYSYSDGSGHEVMTKVQAEPGLAPARDASGVLVRDAAGKLIEATTDARWVGRGRTVLNNKGHPIKQYEPFFSATFDYEDEDDLVASGVTPIRRYDAMGRLVRVDLPSGAFSKIVFDPWGETHFDENDTVLGSAWYAERRGLESADPEGRAARLAAAHADTPRVIHNDTLGRAFRVIDDNGGGALFVTTTTLDIEGNPLAIVDARGVVVMQHRFGMGQQKLWQKSADAGERWMLADAGGQPLRGWDARGYTRRAGYDEARRATHLYLTPPDGAEFLVHRTVFGEALGDAAAATNHRGRPYQRYDGAGVVTSVAYDFKGNLLASERRLATAYRTQVSWSPIEAVPLPEVAGGPMKDLLEDEVFRSSTAYDALDRPISLATPDGSEIRPTYSEAGLLARIEARVAKSAGWTTFVDDIAYDAKAQRERIVLGGLDGSRITTTYSYDPLTLRLARLKTTRDLDGALLESRSYTYDPVGNVCAIEDAADQRIFFAGDVVSPSVAYLYDALYRLIQATGREQAGGLADQQRDDEDLPLLRLPHANDKQAARNYVESYDYDAVGNILRMVHDGGAPSTSWTRRYDVDSASNRLLGTSVPGDEVGQYSAKYPADAHGNICSMPHLSRIAWNGLDEMALADKGGGGVVYFTYDTAGQRVRKVYEHSGIVEERIYLGGCEVYRRRASSKPDRLLFERQTLHVMDAARRVALVEVTTADTAQGGAFRPTTVTRFQLANQLGSAVLEVDEMGRVISTEEYHPYGTTALKSGTGAAEVSLKRYRYTGKERDDETGFSYHGARYYAPWLGRWTAADPTGLADGVNLFVYAHDRPTTLVDPDGTSTIAPDDCPPDPIIPPVVPQFDPNLPISQGPGASGGGAAIAGGSKKPCPKQTPKVPFQPRAHAPPSPPAEPPPAPAPQATPAVPATPATPAAPVTPAVPAATAREAGAAFAKGAAKGLIVGIAVDIGVGIVAGALGVGVGVVGAALAVVLVPIAIYGVVTHWDEIKAGVGRLVHGKGTAADYEAAGEVAGGLASMGASGPASEAGVEIGQTVRAGAEEAMARLGSRLAPVGGPLEGAAGGTTLQSRGGSAKGGSGKVKKYGFGQCEEFANDLVARLKTQGKSGVRIKINSSSKYYALKSKAFGPLGADGGDHMVVQVGETIYDNFRPKGVPASEFWADLENGDLLFSGYSKFDPF